MLFLSATIPNTYMINLIDLLSCEYERIFLIDQ